MLLLCSVFSAFAQSVYPTNFTFLPERPENGSPVQLIYDAKGTPLAGKKNISAVVYQYKNYKWVGTDLAFTGAGDIWKANFKTPADCGLIALKFKSGDIVDNGHDQGYFLQLRDKERKGLMAPGGYAGWGLARSPKLNLDIPGYINFKGISDTASYYWLSQEIVFNPKAKGELVIPYSIALKGFMKEEATPKLMLAVRYLTRADATEDELLKARTITGMLLNDTKRKDSIETVLKTRFPKGSLARLAAHRNINASRELPAVLKASEQFLADFPITTNAQFDDDNRISYGVVYQNMILVATAVNKNDDYLKKYAPVLPYSVVGNMYYKSIEIPYSRKDRTPAELMPLADLLIKRYNDFKTNRPPEYMYMSPTEWAYEFDHSRAGHVFPVQIALLMAAGRNDEAMQFALLAQKYLQYNNATVNDQYAHLLQKKGDNKSLQAVLTKSLYLNQSTPEMLAMLKSSYVRTQGSEKGFDAYIESLKNPADRIAAQKKAASEMMDKPMPDWSMKDMNDKTVTSAQLRGKTVIMDFWATWCVPCKASFPGMKIAVEKYKNDKDVVFYFVDTEERTEDYKAEVKKYIKDNHYPFNVLFDNKAEGAKATGEVFDRIAKAFKISGIPQKLFVDKKGNLRFISIGYNGSATGLADDISMLVELTKSAN
ncbi:Thiol-disulfide isomerase or thioredoxin [Pedobacter westerhofensis]|uniref:Thiol-disulfide isomerase or thioredoxin n=2 Tax=Pedobacter westerhofensis TaxID=425512 RepID=A0A521FS23_9SPHI|nr:Thiol-disulfide isomerase or thioredoxin [Pedobacter westerhofensis]